MSKQVKASIVCASLLSFLLGQVLSGVSGERGVGSAVEVTHQEDADRAKSGERSHDEEAHPVNHSSGQKPLLILLNKKIK